MKEREEQISVGIFNILELFSITKKQGLFFFIECNYIFKQKVRKTENVREK